MASSKKPEVKLSPKQIHDMIKENNFDLYQEIREFLEECVWYDINIYTIKSKKDLYSKKYLIRSESSWIEALYALDKLSAVLDGVVNEYDDEKFNPFNYNYKVVKSSDSAISVVSISLIVLVLLSFII